MSKEKKVEMKKYLCAACNETFEDPFNATYVRHEGYGVHCPWGIGKQISKPTKRAKKLTSGRPTACPKCRLTNSDEICIECGY